jgi:flagellar basal-body rod modification protein FlgD
VSKEKEMVNSVGSNAASNPLTSQTGNSASQANSLRQQDFLRLMVAQVQNQDPMNAETNGDFLAQLAQFSTNDSINNMESSIKQLASSLQSNQALQASALVGRKVLVNNNHLNLSSEGASATATINMVSGVTDLKASIYSSSGELIKTIPLGQPAAGNFDFTWDGTNSSNEKMAAGNYTVKVAGTYNGQAVSVPTMTYANVDSVSLGQNGTGFQLNVAGIGAVSLSDVKQISV